MVPTTDLLRASLLAAMMVLSAVAVGASGAGATATDGSIDRTALATSEHDAVLEDGGRYYLGMTLRRDEGVDPNEDLEILDDDGTLVTLAFADDDGVVMIDTGGDPFETGEYTLVDPDGNEIATFTVFEQTLSASFDPGTVSNSGSDTTTTVSISSNRRNYDIYVTGSRDDDDLGPGELEEIFGTGTPVDADDDGRNDALRVSGSDSLSLTADFEDESEGIYDFTFRVSDTGTSRSASVTVGEEASGDATFAGGDDRITDHRGDVPELTIDLSETDRATVTIGGPNLNYEVEATVRDSDGDGEVTVRWNTDRAGRFPAGQVLTAAGDDRVLSADRIRGDLADDRRIAAARYPVDLSVGGEATATGRIDLREPDQRPRSVTPLTASRDLSSDAVVEEATRSETVAFGDYVVLKVQAAGIHGVIRSRADLGAERDGISVTVRETRTSAGDDPRKRIDLNTFGFESHPEEDAFYLFARTDRGAFEAGDTYQVTFEIDGEENPYVDEDDTVTRSTRFSTVARDVGVDTGIDDTLRVQPTTERVCGSSTLPAGAEVELELRNTDGAQLRGTETATVGDDGRFCVEFDFSGATVDQQFRITVLIDGEEVSRADGVVVERGTVSVADQRPDDGRIVTVESTRLPDGGFVVVERASDGEVLGWSQPLSAGTHEDVVVTLDAAIQQRTDVRVVIHRNNGQGTFDGTGEVDIPYRFDGTTIADTATLRIQETTTTTSTTTTTTTPTTSTTTTTTSTTTTSTTTTTTTTTDDGDGGSPLPVPGFGLGAAVVALLVALAIRRRLA